MFGSDYDAPDGTGVRDYIHALNLAKAHVAALDWTQTHQGTRAFNLGIWQGVSVMEMIVAYAKASCQEIPFTNASRREGDVATCYASPARTHAELGWKSEIGLDKCAPQAGNGRGQTHMATIPAPDHKF